MSARSTIGFGNPYRFNTSSSTISISNSANDACRKCWSNQPPGGFGEILHRLLVDRTWLHSIPGGKGPDHLGPGQVKQSGSTLIFGPSYSASRRAEHFLLTSIVNYSWRVIFWTRPARAVTLQGPTTTARPMRYAAPCVSGDQLN